MAGQTIEELELKFWMLWTLSAAAVKTIFSSFYETKTVHFEKKKFALICETCDCVWFLSWSELMSQEIQKCSDYWGRLSLNAQNAN